MNTYLILNDDNYIIGVCQSETIPDNAIPVEEKPTLKRGVLYKFINGTILEVGEDTLYTAIINKQKRIQDVNDIKVTISTGKIFDGNEISQDRILRAINTANITGQTTTEWILADNTTVEVTLNELKEALALAGQEMSRIWLS